MQALLSLPSMLSSIFVGNNEWEILMQEMKAFWLPSKTPEARAALEKPSLDTICPATGKKLRLKDLITVNFTRLPEGEGGFAMDPVTKDTLSNANKLAVIKPTGQSLYPKNRPQCCLSQYDPKKRSLTEELRRQWKPFVNVNRV